jgi:hypothetical protein
LSHLESSSFVRRLGSARPAPLACLSLVGLPRVQAPPLPSRFSSALPLYSSLHILLYLHGSLSSIIFPAGCRDRRVVPFRLFVCIRRCSGSCAVSDHVCDRCPLAHWSFGGFREHCCLLSFLCVCVCNSVQIISFPLAVSRYMRWTRGLSMSLTAGVLLGRSH